MIGKQELVEELANRTGLSKKEAKLAHETIFQLIQEQLAKGKRVKLVGFGAFFVKTRVAHIGIHPTTRERIQVPETNVPLFRPGTHLRKAINQRGVE
ncbi:DNA-binding protein HU-beta [Pilibacter termitis]|uniref:DNA-binding protein HU n=2 Tax=Pilibacter termitis TaxID=263852 RepID=A0A1T4KSG1_9ENTE|nr:DNA-binding protein HU-beta [Pilibacter termitis]